MDVLEGTENLRNRPRIELKNLAPLRGRIPEADPLDLERMREQAQDPRLRE